MVDRAPDPPGEHGLREAMARDDEATADELAVEYLAAAGYAPDAMKLALLALDRVEAAAELEAAARRVEEATAAAPGELVVVGSIADAISGAARKVDPALEPVIDQRRVYPRPVDADDPIHPALVERVARVTRLAAGRDGERGVDRYRARITGLVFGSDPRRGQVAGTRWSSTRLGLIAELPAGWRAEDDAPRVHLRAEKQEAILWPVGRGWGELAVDQLTGRRRLRIAGHPAVVGVQPVAEGATPTAKGPHLDVSATGPAPSKGSAVAVVFVGKRALVVYVHGAAAEAQLARLLAGIRRMTAAEHAAVEPPRLVFERAPRAATVGELVRELCARPDDARWLSDQTRRVEAGELVKCVE
jgi:predicted Zn-dependent protease